MKPRFQKFDATGYPVPPWFEKMVTGFFDNPKTQHVWDARDPEQHERLKAMATGVIQFLKGLPDGAEIGTNDLCSIMAPSLWDNQHSQKFLSRRIERLRYAGMLDGYFYTLPDNRWKVPKTFYKYHNGRKTT